jgi:hypothetical protein
VYAAVLSAYTKPGTVAVTPFTHYFLLRSTEEIARVPLLGKASSTRSMRYDFGI